MAPQVPAAGCANCPASDCPAKHDHAAPTAAGRNLALLAAATFLAPLALALVGSLVAGGSGPRQLLGAVVGFLAGLGAAAAWVRLAHTSEPDGA